MPRIYTRLTDEHKRKISASLKAGNHHPKHVFGGWNRGIKHSDEAKDKMRQKAIGRINSSDVINKISAALTGTRIGNKNTMYGRRGSSSPRWKGGLTSLRSQIHHNEKYKEWRKFVLDRDNYTCILCGAQGGKLNVDHIIPFLFILKSNNIKDLSQAIMCSQLWDTSNGRTLCLDCHKKTDTYMYKVNSYENN